MKQILSISFLSLLMWSCTQVEEPNPPPQPSPETVDYTITSSEARQLANRKLFNLSRTLPEIKEVLPVLQSLNSRTLRDNDTLAYIVNYEDNKGFVIVSSDRRVSPILAYCEDGNFSLENQIAKESFIDRIGAYLQEKCKDSRSNSGENPVGCIITSSGASGFLHAFAPFNQYVDSLYPGASAGCLPVAVATIMLNTEQRYCFGGDTLVFPHIKQAFQEYSPGLLGSTEQLTYNEAVDQMARLLLHIGRETNVKYGNWGNPLSTGYSVDARNFMIRIGCNVETSLQAFNIFDAVLSISNGNVIYIEGFKPDSSRVGHAWVGIGANYCYDPTTNVYHHAYIFCDWGWGGNCNGYFDGEVFETSEMDLVPTRYFAVSKRQMGYRR